MTIRLARPKDAPQIAAIWNKIIRETTVTFSPTEKTLAEVAALTDENTFVWAAEDRILGFACYFPFRSGEGYRLTVEHTIMLHPDGQGKGIGRALMTALCDHARAAGLHSMVAACSGENADALAFHARLGFEKVATMPELGFKFGRWIDLILMQKRL